MSLATIGQKLRSAREAQGLTLVQVYERTKIPLNHLQAVEQGDVDELPEPVFIFGFIKRYAECIGLDGQILADDYKQHLDSASGNGRRKNAESMPYYATSDYMAKSKPRITTPVWKLGLFNGLIILGVVGTITWLINSQQSMVNQADPNLMSLRQATNRITPTAPPMPTQPAPNGQVVAPVPQDTSQKLTLSASRHVWVEVKRMSNGESIFTGYLEQGDRRDFEDPSGLIVRAGDGGSLSVENQGKMEPFGLNGKVVERKFVSAVAAAPAATTGAAATTGVGTSVAGTGTYVRSATAPVVRRPRRVVSEAPRPRVVETRRYDSGPREVPSRYSEGRLDSD